MSRDIRSFFTTISKKTVSNKDSSLSDVIPETPETKNKSKKLKKSDEPRSKRKRIVEISSDSEPETNSKKKINSSPKKEPKKSKESPKKKIPSPKAKSKLPSPKSNSKLFSPKTKSSETPSKVVRKLNPIDAFGDEPIKQEKVIKKRNSELNIHNDDDFDKTLLELDEEELLKSVEDQSSSSTKVIKITPKKQPITNQVEIKDKTPSKTPSRKRKLSDKDESSEDPDLERHEKKRYSAMLYQKYLHRGGPAKPGSKWTPKGKPDCLKGLCFIITGVLESLERETAQTLITDHGGRCTQSVSGKVNYMVLGEDAGPAKVEKARKLGTKTISEDDLIDLICVKSGIKNKNIIKTEKSDEEPINSNAKNVKENKTSEECKKEIEDEIPSQTIKKSSPTKKKNGIEKVSPVKKEKSPVKNIKLTPIKNEPTKKVTTPNNNLAWVDKYKPTDINQIIGQQGDRSNLKKLITWMNNWHKNRARETQGKGIPRPSPWAKDDDGAYFRAVLLSGPPGVGKTTTATLVCKHLDYDTVEFNASDTRNKRMIHDEVAQILKTTSLAGYFSSGSAPTKKHALLMDEVDGMSGNEDRGGIQELIGMIKTTNVPIICMCNDRQHPKIRTLANYCFDLRFAKPRVEQIRGAMMSICFKEGLKIKGDVLAHIIQNTGQDVRQTLNQLSLFATNTTTDSEKLTEQSKFINKDTKLGPWEVIRKVFSAEEHKTMSIADKSKLFFYDYSIGPLFVHDNYLKVVPHCPKKDVLKRFAETADAISMGDVIDAKIRSTQNWSLLEMQAMYSSVLPGHFLEGHFGGQIDFPGWLGKNSKANRFQRMLSEIHAHTRMSISGDRTAVGLDYVRSLRDAIALPMRQNGADGVEQSINVMRAYNLLREDVTNLVELAGWSKQKDPFDAIDSKVKAAFTRSYNKEAPALPYAAGAGAVKNKRGAAASNDLDEGLAEYEDDAAAEESNGEEDDITKDAMIKAKKPSTKAATTKKASTSKASNTRGKGPAKPKGNSKRAK